MGQSWNGNTEPVWECQEERREEDAKDGCSLQEKERKTQEKKFMEAMKEDMLLMGVSEEGTGDRGSLTRVIRCGLL